MISRARWILIGALLCGCAAHRKPKPVAAPPPPPPPPSSVSVALPPGGAEIPAPALTGSEKLYPKWGVVRSVDAQRHRLTLAVAGRRELELVVASNAKLNKGGGSVPLALGQVRPGDHVFVRIAGNVVAFLHVKIGARKAKESPPSP